MMKSSEKPMVFRSVFIQVRLCDYDERKEMEKNGAFVTGRVF